MGLKNIGLRRGAQARQAVERLLDVLGGFPDLPAAWIQKYKIEHVFIALPMNRYDDARRVFGILSQQLVEVHTWWPDVPNLAGLTLTTANLDGLPLIGLRESPHFGLNIVVKRAMDMALSLIGLLLLLSPLLALLGRSGEAGRVRRSDASTARSAADSTASRFRC